MVPGDAFASGVSGGPGATAGVTRVTLSDGGPVPITFVAVTLTVYSVPGASPSMAHASDPVVVHVAPPGTAVAV